MRRNVGCEGPRPWMTLAALVVLVACVKGDRPPQATLSAAGPDIPGAEAWLVKPAAFKSAGVRTSCILTRVANNPTYPSDDFGPDDSVALSDEEARRLYGCAKAAMAANACGISGKNSRPVCFSG